MVEWKRFWDELVGRDFLFLSGIRLKVVRFRPLLTLNPNLTLQPLVEAAGLPLLLNGLGLFRTIRSWRFGRRRGRWEQDAPATFGLRRDRRWEGISVTPILHCSSTPSLWRSSAFKF
mgnify:CR=1 FL=1